MPRCPLRCTRRVSASAAYTVEGVIVPGRWRLAYIHAPYSSSIDFLLRKMREKTLRLRVGKIVDDAAESWQRHTPV